MTVLYISENDLDELVLTMRRTLQNAPGASGMRFLVPTPKARDAILMALNRLVPPTMAIEVMERRR